MDLKILPEVIFFLYVFVIFLISCYLCLKKKFHFSTIILSSFVFHFLISLLISIFFIYDTIAIRIIFSFTVISLFFSVINILLTFFFKLLKKRFCTVKFNLLYFLLVLVLYLGIWELFGLIPEGSLWFSGSFFIYFNCGFVFLLTLLLVWHYFEMKK